MFTGTADGACIEIRREPFEKALKKIAGVTFGEIDYLRLDDVDKLKPSDLDRLPYVKRVGFAAEEEYRVVYETREPQRPAYKLEFPLEWIGRIYLNPWLPDPLYTSVKETLHALPGCSKIPIVKSRLIDNARWKKAGDNVVGNAAATKILKLRITKRPESASKSKLVRAAKPVKRPTT